MSIRISRRIPVLAIALIGTALALGGCATPATYQAMTPTSVAITKQHAKSVSVEVGGGRDTNSMGKSQIADDQLRLAVVDAIKTSKTFSSVVEGKGGDYKLDVSIINMTQPSFGLSFTVTMEMGWSLTEVSSGKLVWREAVKSEHTATTSDAFAGVARLRMATEGAAKNNVAAGLAKISALAL